MQTAKRFKEVHAACKTAKKQQAERKEEIAAEKNQISALLQDKVAQQKEYDLKVSQYEAMEVEMRVQAEQITSLEEKLKAQLEKIGEASRGRRSAS
jgi:hypothetical protein